MGVGTPRIEAIFLSSVRPALSLSLSVSMGLVSFFFSSFGPFLSRPTLCVILPNTVNSTIPILRYSVHPGGSSVGDDVTGVDISSLPEERGTLKSMIGSSQ